jgi:tyrosine-specific transport protein
MQTNANALSKFTVFSAAFLVAGTIIGGGMLALPVAVAVNGFFPSAVYMIIAWGMMTLTALLFLEVGLWLEPGVHVISMTSRLLGNWGRAIAWVLYLFICYASLVAYAAAGGTQAVAFIEAVAGWTLNHFSGVALFIFLLCAALYAGTKTVGRVNTVLFLGLIGAYLGLVGMGFDELNPEYLERSIWKGAWLGLPLFLTSFSFQTMVPSLTPYLQRNRRALQIAIIGGTTLSLIIYLVWQALIMGIVPLEGPHGLLEAWRIGEPATQFVSEHVEGYHVALLANFFAFFAIVTSFLGIGLGLWDFLSDGLKVPEKGKGQLLLGALIVFPTLIFATQLERVFYLALEATGGYGDTILNGLIPVMLVWAGRYYEKLAINPPAWYERRRVLSCIFLFFLGVVILKLLLDLGFTI